MSKQINNFATNKMVKHSSKLHLTKSQLVPIYQDGSGYGNGNGNGSGNGSGTVTFKQSMPSTTYGVGYGFEESGTTRITTGVCCSADKTVSGFKVVVAGASATSEGIKVEYTVVEGKSAY